MKSIESWIAVFLTGLSLIEVRTAHEVTAAAADQLALVIRELLAAPRAPPPILPGPSLI